MSPDSMKDLVRRYLTEIHYHNNFAVIDEAFHQNFVGHAPSPMPEVRGIEALKQVFIDAKDTLTDKQVTFHHLLVDGEFITVHWALTGKHTGEFMGASPSGKQITIENIMIERFQDDKIVEAWAQGNFFSLMKQLGVL